MADPDRLPPGQTRTEKWPVLPVSERAQRASRQPLRMRSGGRDRPMPISEHLRGVRAKLGHDLLMQPAVTGLVFDDAGRVLLQKHGDTLRWVAPGGSVEPDEQPVDALLRELWEETGLLVEVVSLLGVFGGPTFRVQYRNGDVCAYMMAAFECRVRSGALRLDGDESLELRYVARDEIDALDLAPWARIVVPAAFAHRGRSVASASAWLPPR